MSIPPSPHPPVSQTTIAIAGLQCTIHGLAELPAASTRIACLWLLHPRLATRDSMTPLATTIIREWMAHSGAEVATAAATTATTAETAETAETAAAQSSGPGGGAATGERLGLIAVAVDHRNHGSRAYDDRANLTWLDGNDSHAVDMWLVYHGTSQDVMQLRPLLESYLFPLGQLPPRQIVTHLALGVSLGGHAAWHLVLHDPAICAAVVVVGSPDYASLMKDRARRARRASYMASDPPGAAFFGSADFPLGLVEQVERWDPRGVFLGLRTARREERGWDGRRMGRLADVKARCAQMLGGKRLLNLVGVDDQLVPYATADPFLSWMDMTVMPGVRAKGKDFHITELLVKDVGHEMIPGMVDASVGFIIDILDEKSNGGDSHV